VCCLGGGPGVFKGRGSEWEGMIKKVWAGLLHAWMTAEEPVLPSYLKAGLGVCREGAHRVSGPAMRGVAGGSRGCTVSHVGWGGVAAGMVAGGARCAQGGGAGWNGAWLGRGLQTSPPLSAQLP
jgi:hypothetical protein